MATSPRLNLGERVARQALVEKASYTGCDSDLDRSFFPDGIPDNPAPEPLTFRSQYLKWIDELKNRAYDPVSPATLACFISRAKTVLSIVGPSTTLINASNRPCGFKVADYASLMREGRLPE
jgi:hypothetical protein